MTISGTPDVDLIEVLSQSRLFRDVAIDEIEHLLQNCEQLTLDAGQTLLSRNTPNGSIYIIVAGRVSVHLTSPDDEPASYIGVGECAGEMSVIDGNVVSADVIADQPSRVLRISQDVLWAMVERLARNCAQSSLHPVNACALWQRVVHSQHAHTARP